MKIKTTVHIHHEQYFFEEHGAFAVYKYKLDDMEHRTYVCSQEIEIDVPDNYDPRAQKIAALQAQATKEAADYQNTVTDIQRRIAELQAIEFTA